MIGVSTRPHRLRVGGVVLGLCVVALWQHVHRCLEGHPDLNQCFGRAQWDVMGRLWGQSGLGMVI